MSLVNKKFCGTNKDGSLNNEYCKFCFADGKFRDEGISMQEKINRNISMAIKMGMNEEKARKIANSIIPKLKRWK
jgi:radical SAM superfamily enzyme